MLAYITDSVKPRLSSRFSRQFYRMIPLKLTPRYRLHFLRPDV